MADVTAFYVDVSEINKHWPEQDANFGPLSYQSTEIVLLATQCFLACIFFGPDFP